jgi:hypothetical protein
MSIAKKLAACRCCPLLWSHALAAQSTSPCKQRPKVTTWADSNKSLHNSNPVCRTSFVGPKPRKPYPPKISYPPRTGCTPTQIPYRLPPMINV